MSGKSGLPDAYDLLAGYGVTGDSSMADVHRAGMNAQRLGALTPERSQAWRELRDPEKRLALDLFRFQRDPELFGKPQAGEPDPWDLLDEIVVDPEEPLGPLPLPESLLEELK
jgi:hypothetical protein